MVGVFLLAGLRVGRLFFANQRQTTILKVEGDNPVKAGMIDFTLTDRTQDFVLDVAHGLQPALTERDQTPIHGRLLFFLIHYFTPQPTS
jgi:hypothetical protein